MNKVLLSIFLLLFNFLAFSQDSISLNDRIFEKVEKEADYPGGIDTWKHFLEKNLNPNVPVDNGAPIGKYTVYIQFIVNVDGSISDIKPLTRLGYGMETEVVNLIKKSGAWEPASQDGRHVKAYRKQPVTFQVIQDNLDIVTKTPFVLYSGKENEMSIRVDKVKNEDINVAITKGTITKTAGNNYVVKVRGTGRAILTITGKKNKELASVSFEIMDKE
jgi:hypothetical protein